MKHIYITVSGTMGVGKTTLTKIIAQEFNYKLILENFKANPFLPRFYKKMDRWAFHSQSFFMTEKISQLEQIHSLIKRSNIIQDTSVYQDVFSYAKAQYKFKNMDKAEWHLYLKIYKTVEKRIPKPDCIIYITASIDSIFKRIKGRDRGFEQTLSDKKFIKYLTVLNKLNEAWIKKIGKRIKIIRLETDSFDYRYDKKRRSDLIKFLKNEKI